MKGAIGFESRLLGSDSLSNCQIPEALGQWCDRHSSPIPLAQLARRSIPVPA
ncbi:hypothetical protein H6G52_08950 [Limnothrix sp. FACHB-881]|nr:hypothetical protein [Limnothrix sp. FACHB-881]